MARILLVDDEKVARALYGDYLTGAGHEVLAVASSKEAKAALSAKRFDLLVTDLILPDEDGLDVLRYVKEHHPGIEVIVITALDKVDPAVRAIKSGAAEYLVKPVSPDALALAVNRALTTRQLLFENAQLRRDVELLETGQRIATSLQKDRLLPTACGAFQQVTACDAVFLYTKHSSGEFHISGSLGSDPEHEAQLAATLDPRLREGSTAAFQLEGLPAPYNVGLVYPANAEDQTWGLVVLVFRDAPSEHTPSAASYLARHLGLALRNLGKFAEVQDLAYLDDLTHLFNARYLEHVLEREVKSSTRSGVAFSLLFLDLDYFKSVNDTHGHLVGSKLLVEVSRVLKNCVRDEDIVVRWGGDEYVVLLRATDSGGALKVAERIRRSMESHQFLAREALSIHISTCIGVASFPEHAHDKTSLLDMADRAMYRGKKGTRNVIYMAASGFEASPVDRQSHHGIPEGDTQRPVN